MKKIDCKYYCKDYLLEGMCKLHSDWSDPMPMVAYCIGECCKERESIANEEFDTDNFLDRADQEVFEWYMRDASAV